MSTYSCTTMKVTGAVLLGLLPYLASASAATLKQGSMKKQGGRWKNWKKRWFVLSKDQTITIKYYNTESESGVSKENLKGEISLEGIKPNNVRSREPHKKDEFGFEIETPTRTWLLDVPDEKTRNEWIHEIHSAMGICEGQRLVYTGSDEALLDDVWTVTEIDADADEVYIRSTRARDQAARPTYIRYEQEKHALPSNALTRMCNKGEWTILSTKISKTFKMDMHLIYNGSYPMFKKHERWVIGKIVYDQSGPSGIVLYPEQLKHLSYQRKPLAEIKSNLNDEWKIFDAENSKCPGPDGKECVCRSDPIGDPCKYFGTQTPEPKHTHCTACSGKGYALPVQTEEMLRRLAADPSSVSGSSSFWFLSMIPLLFLIYWFFSRWFQPPVKRSRKQSTYRCHYPENAEDFSDVEPEIDMV